ncbi:lipoprotein [Leminorella grimontii]|uniref:Inner membrane lipoprotein DcrB n=2 Tax=Leminorella grimontii TaxID=82981 RepID=A0AAV5N3H1_9GAMM|nr:DcrB-related protein [Leminorella grimontii]KFC93728.1 DcrB family protein [Leminorella grimontii ATCC 33999 = DSM 5078]GKX55574.1 lipoprotein [Leminorella grimontii]
MQKLMKTMGLCLFAVSLAACDGNKDSSTTPADNGSSAAAQPGASADGQTQVLGGKVSFNVPKGLQDQSGKSPSQTTNMAVFADNAAQKMLIVISSSMPGDSLENLITRMEAQQKMRDGELTLLKKAPVEAGGQTLQRLDTLVRIDGKKNYSSTILGQIGQQLLTIQLTYPAEQQADAEKAVDAFIASLKIQP